ncbi:hypothetical protein [Streptomyces candidus]|uniref:Uncharacterized protein n=1 Tax=Streptomyces candidus TaxID=67283 RepID=A0A7X0HKL4_9ACTN|nr:hypothetical protein [Streptomyces candidus]MBB6439386.1 hypothetical protein [Streptomyces candidus]GHH54947.1 hypothetical protein GCM10018773_58710 [Streptomyces candidus]
MHSSTRPAADPAEKSDTVRCTCCGLHKPLVSGAVIDHRPTRTATADCPGSGARRRTGAERAEGRPHLGAGRRRTPPAGAAADPRAAALDYAAQAAAAR